jgi:thiol-disulfide isomerase/thioredoxin
VCLGVTALGHPAPQFELPDSAGVPHRLPDAPATIVYFTSNRCPACLAWQPRLADAAADYARRGVRFLAVNVPCQFPGPIGARMPIPDGRLGITMVIDKSEWRHITYLDGSGLQTARAWLARVVPDLFVLDQDHRIRYRGAPDSAQFEPDKNANWLRDALDAVLNGREPPFVPSNLIGCPIKWNNNAHGGPR